MRKHARLITSEDTGHRVCQFLVTGNDAREVRVGL
jgi:hypothetical protein